MKQGQGELKGEGIGGNETISARPPLFLPPL